MHLIPKVNRAQVFSAKMPRKLRGRHARRKRDLVRCIGSRLKEKICMAVRDITHPGRFKSKPEEVLSKIRTSAIVCAGQPSSTVSFLTVRTFWIIIRKDKKLIIFLYTSVVVLLCYTTGFCWMSRDSAKNPFSTSFASIL